jgi:NADH-quinone oxidoreductase subunit K
MRAILISFSLLVGGLATIFWNRNNIIKIFLGAELCLLGANWNFFCSAWVFNLFDGYTFILFVLAIAAAEVAVGLGLAVLVFYRVGSIVLERVERMRG